MERRGTQAFKGHSFLDSAKNVDNSGYMFIVHQQTPLIYNAWISLPKAVTWLIQTTAEWWCAMTRWIIRWQWITIQLAVIETAWVSFPKGAGRGPFTVKHSRSTCCSATPPCGWAVSTLVSQQEVPRFNDWTVWAFPCGVVSHRVCMGFLQCSSSINLKHAH